MELLLLEPVFKQMIWGGSRLRDDFGYDIPGDNTGECWAISAHPHGDCTLKNTEYKGKTLSWLWENHRELFGNVQGDRFPLLIKIIDAKADLSIQVHPDDDFALLNENEYGKNEMWYILDAEEGASLYYGTNKEITKDEFRARIEDNTILDVLKKVPVHKGDVFFIEAGTIHAIGEGIVICEIQQNSNTTYRVYDFGRVGKDGKPRELHIEKAIDVSNLTPLESDFKPIGEEKDYGTYKCAMMATCEYFTTYVYDVKTECSVKVDEESFASFVIVDGEGSIESDDTMLSIRKGDSVFASANTGKVTIKGSCRFILSKV